MKQQCARLLVGVCALSAIAMATPAAAQVCGSPATTSLIAGQHFTAGTISIYNDATNIYVTYTTNAPWVMSDAHVAIANALAGIPQTRAGNPIPGRFAYSATFDPEVTTYTVGIPYAGVYAEGQNLFVAAHAMVQAPRDQGGSQTGWASGPGFPGNNWAMYVNFTLQSCGGGGDNS